LTGVLAAVLAAEQASSGDAHRVDESGSCMPNASRTVAQAALSAWVHGVAGEFETGAAVRGRTVMDVVHGVPGAWYRLETPEVYAPGVLVELPALDP
jgi:NAD(P)H-hydrate repair Nnr-like enzyme with NAD(P)H-hydrate dehydratase domain